MEDPVAWKGQVESVTSEHLAFSSLTTGTVYVFWFLG